MTRYVTPKTNPDWINKLPFIEVCNAWNVTVRQFQHPHSDYDGFYEPTHNTIWLYCMHPRIFVHELCHISDERNYTISSCAPPEVFISDRAMVNYIHDEVVATASAHQLLKRKRYTNKNAGWDESWHYIKKMCELGDLSPEDTLTECAERTLNCTENVWNEYQKQNKNKQF